MLACSHCGSSDEQCFTLKHLMLGVSQSDDSHTSSVSQTEITVLHIGASQPDAAGSVVRPVSKPKPKPKQAAPVLFECKLCFEMYGLGMGQAGHVCPWTVLSWHGASEISDDEPANPNDEGREHRQAAANAAMKQAMLTAWDQPAWE